MRMRTCTHKSQQSNSSPAKANLWSSLVTSTAALYMFTRTNLSPLPRWGWDGEEGVKMGVGGGEQLNPVFPSMTHIPLHQRQKRRGSKLIRKHSTTTSHLWQHPFTHGGNHRLLDCYANEGVTLSSPQGAGIAQWLEHRTRDWKVAGSNPCWNGGRIFFSRVDFLCWLLFRYPFHPRVTTVARKKIPVILPKSAGGRLQLNTHTPYVCGFYWTVLRHWSQLVPNMSNDIWGH